MSRPLFRRALWLMLTLALVLPGSASEVSRPVAVDLRLTTHLGDGREFIDGDRIGWLLSLNADAYVYLFYRDADGALWQLLPNPHLADHFIRAGAFQPLPGARPGLGFVVRPPFGQEVVYAFASDRGRLEFPRASAAGQLARLALDIEQIEAYIRAESAQLFDSTVLRLSTRAAERRGVEP